MNLEKTAVILIGYQNDYFAKDGILRGVIEETTKKESVVNNTVQLLRALFRTPALFITTPIIFTPDYRELFEPIGILKAIKESGAFMQGSKGAEVIREFDEFKEKIITIPGKRGLNAFSNTELDTCLAENGISHVVIAGAVTSICIDSTAREAFERGYQVTIVSDCISGRTVMEKNFYYEQVFPLYASLLDHRTMIESVHQDQ